MSKIDIAAMERNAKINTVAVVGRISETIFSLHEPFSPIGENDIKDEIAKHPGVKDVVRDIKRQQVPSGKTDGWETDDPEVEEQVRAYLLDKVKEDLVMAGLEIRATEVSDFKKFGYDLGLEAGKTDGWMAMEDTLQETYDDHHPASVDDLIQTDFQLWTGTDHFQILYRSKLIDKLNESIDGGAGGMGEDYIDALSEFEDGFFGGYLEGRGSIGRDIYALAKKIIEGKKPAESDDDRTPSESGEIVGALKQAKYYSIMDNYLGYISGAGQNSKTKEEAVDAVIQQMVDNEDVEEGMLTVSFREKLEWIQNCDRDLVEHDKPIVDKEKPEGGYKELSVEDIGGRIVETASLKQADEQEPPISQDTVLGDGEGQTYEIDDAELDLMIKNEQKDYNWLMDLYKNLAYKMRRGVYQHDLAKKLFMYLVKDVAERAYEAKKLWADGPGDRVLPVSKEVMDKECDDLASEFEQAYENDDYQFMTDIKNRTKNTKQAEQGEVRSKDASLSSKIKELKIKLDEAEKPDEIKNICEALQALEDRKEKNDKRRKEKKEHKQQDPQPKEEGGGKDDPDPFGKETGNKLEKEDDKDDGVDKESSLHPGMTGYISKGKNKGRDIEIQKTDGNEIKIKWKDTGATNYIDKTELEDVVVWTKTAEINDKTKKEIIGVINECLKRGMKDPNSIYQQVIDTVPNALSDSETEQFVYNFLNPKEGVFYGCRLKTADAKPTAPPAAGMKWAVRKKMDGTSEWIQVPVDSPTTTESVDVVQGSKKMADLPSASLPAVVFLQEADQESGVALTNIVDDKGVLVNGPLDNDELDRWLIGNGYQQGHSPDEWEKRAERKGDEMKKSGQRVVFTRDYDYESWINHEQTENKRVVKGTEGRLIDSNATTSRIALDNGEEVLVPTNIVVK